jgi:hypothetical protein
VNKEDRRGIKKRMESYVDHVDHLDQGPLSRMLCNFPSESTKALMALSLSDFERGTYVVKIRSALLGEDIYFVSNERLLDRVPEGFAVYTARELRALKGVTKEHLKGVHHIKRIMDGEILD